MDERRNKKTTLTSYDDFNVGDLVVIDSRLDLTAGVDKVEHKLLGVVAGHNEEKGLELFPQVPVFVFSKRKVELHWPSYLRVVSSTNR
mgnify:CR=1 FL=1